MRPLKKLVEKLMSLGRGCKIPVERDENAPLNEQESKKLLSDKDLMVKLRDQACRMMQLNLIFSAGSSNEAALYKSAIENADETEFTNILPPIEYPYKVLTDHAEMNKIADIGIVRTRHFREAAPVFINNCIHVTKVTTQIVLSNGSDLVETLINDILYKKLDAVEIFFETEKGLEFYHLAWQSDLNGVAVAPITTLNQSISQLGNDDVDRRTFYLESVPVSLIMDIKISDPQYVFVAAWKPDGTTTSFVMLNHQQIIQDLQGLKL